MHDMTPARASRRIARAADTWPPLAATVIALGRGVWLFPLDVLFRTVGLRYGWLRALFSAVPAPILAGLGRLRAERAAWRATRQVPAYRRFLGAAGVRLDPLVPLGILTRLPETNKATTSLTERWADRRVPMTRPSRDGPSQCRAARLESRDGTSPARRPVQAAHLMVPSGPCVEQARSVTIGVKGVRHEILEPASSNEHESACPRHRGRAGLLSESGGRGRRGLLGLPGLPRPEHRHHGRADLHPGSDCVVERRRPGRLPCLDPEALTAVRTLHHEGAPTWTPIRRLPT